VTKKNESDEDPGQAATEAAPVTSIEARREQLLYAEKFAAVGLLAAEIAHEINNPSTFVITNLTVMMDYVDTIGSFHEALRAELADGPIDAERFEALANEHEMAFLSEDLDSLLARSLAGLNRIHQIVQDLRYFSHDRRIDVGWVDVAALVRAAANLVRHEARYRARVILDLPEFPAAHTDPNRLAQVLLNVLVNAVQAIPAGDPEGNEVRVEARRKGDEIVIAVSDTGDGIAADNVARVFEPFFTTKRPGEGTGLGLSISRDIMRALGGDISVESKPSRGSTFYLTVPIERNADE